MLYSTHSFMLPLKWDYLPKNFKKDLGKFNHDYDERTDLSRITKSLLKSGWQRPFYSINNSTERYNEYSYFHAYATNTLFDLQQRTEVENQIVDASKMMCYFEIEPEQDEQAFFKIETKKFGTYHLNLKGISLHVYSTGICILTFNLENEKYDNIEDVLKINDYGRRIYPQFLSDRNPYDLTESVKEAFLATKISLNCRKLNNGITIEEDFSEYQSLLLKEVHQMKLGNYVENEIVIPPKYIRQLFKEDFVFNLKNESKEKIRFNLIGDDRMFFQSWYGNNSTAKSLGNSFFPKLYYKQSNLWYAYIFGDTSSTNLGLANNDLKIKHIEDHTYSRWVEYNTFFGFSRDSFVSITNGLENLPLPINVHMKSTYYQMAVLSLAQRASVLKFSSEVSGLSKLGKSDKDKAANLIEKLYLNYIEFINKIYFREVSPQIQGIEIYAQFHKSMNIANDIKDLDQEIAELYNFSMLVKQNKLNIIATLFLPFSIVFGILGANMFDISNLNTHGFSGFIWLITGLIISAGISLLIFYFNKILSFLKKQTL